MSGAKRKGLPPIQKGPTVMAPPPKIVETFEVEKTDLSAFEEQALVIDTNLLVGPIYDNTKQRAKALKEQLGDINTRLQTTLTTFDAVNPGDHDDDMLGDLAKLADSMASGQMKATLKHFINNYRDMSSHIQDSSKEREDILFQLSDWFTMDHMDDLYGPTTHKEVEKEAEQGYTSALVNFEKFKQLQNNIKLASAKGLNVDHLLQEKRRMEKDVMGGLAIMKKGKEKAKAATSGGASTWRHAADEVVSMLRKVRTEGSDEMDTVKKKVDGLVLELKQKTQYTDQLRKEVKERKNMMSRYADDNSDLTDEVARLRFKIKKLEANLDNATKLLHNQIDLKNIQLPKQEEEGTGKEITVTVSFILRQLGEATDANNLKRMDSDPAFLRKQIRDNRETIEAFSRELIKLNEKVEKLEADLKRKESILSDLELVNNELRERVTESRSDEGIAISQQPSSFSVSGVRMALSSHACNCKCHQASMASLHKPSSQEISGQDDDKEKSKLLKKLDYFRKALSDAELRLSQAYKEMAEMRRKSLAADDSSTELLKIESGGESSGDEEEKTSKEPVKDKKKVAKEPKRKKNVRRKSIKPKGKKDKSLPPINQPIIPEPEVPSPPEFNDNRDNELWQVGDIQGRLDMLVTGIMSYVTDIGKLVGGEEETGRKAIVQQFQFGQKPEDKAVKNANNKRAAERRQRRDQVMLSGQRAVAIIREVYDMLTAALDLRHSDFEAIYRSFKQHQQIRAVHHAAMMGRLPQGSNVVRMGSNENAVEYYLKSYGGGGGGGVAGGGRGHPSGQPFELSSSRVKDRPASGASSKASLQSGVGIRIEDGMVYGMKRSKSDLHLYDDSMRPGTMSLMTGERAPLFMMGAQEPRQDVVGGNKEEVSLPTATLTKKGLIKLTSLDQELPDQEIMSMNKNETAPKKTAQKALIKRKDIRDQIRAGAQMLEEERRKNQDEEDEGEVRLEDYTIGDLQTALGMVQENPDSPVLLDVEERSEGGGQGRSPKPPKQPLVTESIKQQTFKLPILEKK